MRPSAPSMATLVEAPFPEDARMTDISVFKKMLDQKPYSTAKGYVYLAARLEIRTGSDYIR